MLGHSEELRAFLALKVLEEFFSRISTLKVVHEGLCISHDFLLPSGIGLGIATAIARGLAKATLDGLNSSKLVPKPNNRRGKEVLGDTLMHFVQVAQIFF